MRVLIDARGVGPKLQGVQRHVLNLLLGLSYLDSEFEFLVLFDDPTGRKMIERSGGPHRHRFQWLKAGGWIEQLAFPVMLRLNGIRLVHDTGGRGLRTGGVPCVCTVHELEAVHFGDKSPAARRKIVAVRRMLQRSRFTITVSDTLGQEVESRFNISRPRIRMIPNAVDPRYFEKASAEEVRAARERFGLSGPYYLCVTADRPSKNNSLPLSVARDWKGEGQWVFTLPAGGGRPGSGTVRFLDRVEDVWLRPLYAEAAGVVVPSLYEGFSLPPVEALAGGSLPVVSDIPPHRELLGGILPPELFFDPRSGESLAGALEAVKSGGAPLKASVLEKFRSVSDRYSVRNTAEGVHAVYREASGESTRMKG